MTVSSEGLVRFCARAWETGPTVRPIAQEYAELLNRMERYEEAFEFIAGLPEAIRSHERLAIALARAAFKTRRFEHVESLFELAPAQIRECETSLTDLWFAYHEERISETEGIPIDDSLRERVRWECVPPKGIDFRMTAH